MADITENIVASVDDGFTISAIQLLTGYTENTFGTYGGYGYWAGVRFQSIALDQGVTIDLANLILQVDGFILGTPNVDVFGDLVADAPGWATTSRMKDITKTTAFTNFAPTANGSATIDVTAIVQEIVDQGSWANGNDMRFALFSTLTSGNNSTAFDDYEKSAGTPGRLEIDWTAPVAGGFVNKVESGGLVGRGGLPGVGGGLAG